MLEQLLVSQNSKVLYFLIGFFLLVLQFVVGLGEKVSPTDIEEGMRVGYFPLLTPFFLDLYW